LEVETMRWLSALIVIGLLYPRVEVDGPVALAHLTVIDATGRPPQVDMTVIVRDGRIVALGKTDHVNVPADAQVSHAAGKFLIPGLWDMHVHTVSPDYFPLYLANGVTGVRDMHSFFPDTPVQWRKDIAAGKTLGPRMVVAGALVDGASPFWPGPLVATDEKSGQADDPGMPARVAPRPPLSARARLVPACQNRASVPSPTGHRIEAWMEDRVTLGRNLDMKRTGAFSG
jgi:hypothetical protein